MTNEPLSERERQVLEQSQLVKKGVLAGRQAPEERGGFDTLKILLWEKNGFVIWYKRLEKRRFP